MEANMRVMGVLMGKVKEIPSVDPTLTKSGYAADAKAVGERLDEIGTDRLGAEDVVNSLESDAEDKPLSAAMGKMLRDLVGSGGAGSASDVVYDGEESNLDADNVQNAITLLASMVRGCLPLEGGTLTGENIYMGNGNARIHGNEKALSLQALNGAMDNNNRRSIALYNSNYQSDVRDALKLEDIHNGARRIYSIYGTHNMVQGFYVGDGVAIRTINFETVGNAILLFGNSPSYGLVAALVCSQGAIAFRGISSEVLGSSTIRFSGGVLTVNASALNEQGAEYYYYVL